MKALATTTLAVSAAAALIVAAPLAANAHVGVSPSTTAAGSPSVLTFSFSHGCEGSPTSALTFSIPESIESVTPTVHPGWTIAETPGTVTYTAITPVADGLRDTVELSVVLPAGEEGDVVAFPVVQTCVEGEHAWADLAEGDAEPDSPPRQLFSRRRMLPPAATTVLLLKHPTITPPQPKQPTTTANQWMPLVVASESPAWSSVPSESSSASRLAVGRRSHERRDQRLPAAPCRGVRGDSRHHACVGVGDGQRRQRSQLRCVVYSF